MNIKEIGLYCKEFRKEVLKLSLKDFAEITETNNKNISSFENGRANNIRYLFLYYNLCENEFIRTMFIKELFRVGDKIG